MIKKHPCLLSNPLPPNGGERVTDINDLDDDYKYRKLKEEKIFIPPSKVKFKIRIIEPKVPVVKNSWTLVREATEYPPYGWEELFIQSRGEFNYLDLLLKADKHFFPERKNIFRTFRLCKPENVKVVIFGPGPDHIPDEAGICAADGLAFSINKKYGKEDKGIKNIFMELKKSIPNFKIPKTTDLSPWVKQGVLLLNKALTTRVGSKESHTKEWNGFMSRTIGHLKNINPECIFVFWGGSSSGLTEHIGENTNFPILKAPHPRAYQNSKFAGCDHFVLINQLLQQQGKKTIDWRL